MSEARIHLDAQVQIRRDIEANWIAVDPVLRDGEIAYSRDINRIKIGDGAHKWSELTYMLSVDAPGGGDGDVNLEQIQEILDRWKAEVIDPMWQLVNGDVVTDKQVIIKNNLIVEKDTSSGGEGEDTPSAGLNEEQLQQYLDEHKYVTEDDIAGLIPDVSDQLEDYYTKPQTDSAISTAIAAIDLSIYAKSKDVYTKTQIDEIEEGIDTALATKAKQSDLVTLQGEVDNIETVLGLSETAEGYINTWAEVVAFLDGYKNADDLATILSGINADIAKNAEDIATLDSDKADKTTVTALAERVSANEGAIGALDKRVTAEEAVTTTYASWWADLKKWVTVEDGNVKISTNLIVTGDTSSGGSGQDTPASGTVTGIKVSASDTLYPNNAGVIDMVSTLDGYATETWVNGQGYLKEITQSMIGTALGSANNGGKVLISTGGGLGWASLPTSLPASDVYAWAKKSSLALEDVPDLSSKYLPLAGGTISGQTQINNSLVFGSLSGTSSYSNGIYFTTVNDGSSHLVRIESGVLKYNGNTLIHSGNIGSQFVEGIGTAYANQSINFGKEGKVRMIYATASNFTDLGYPLQYMSGLSVVTGYTGWQMVTYGGTIEPNPYFRKCNDRGTWLEWKKLAFLDDNVASATKLQTARTIWGQSFDGTGNVDGDFYMKGEVVSLAGDLTGGNTNAASPKLWLGAFHPGVTRYTGSYIQALGDSGYGNHTISFFTKKSSDYTTEPIERMRIASNGNVGIGTLPAHKLDVAGAGNFAADLYARSVFHLYQIGDAYRLTHYVTSDIARIYNVTSDGSFYGDMYIGQNSTGAIVIKGGSYVGVGATPSGSYKFEVSGTAKVSGAVTLSSTLSVGGNITAASGHVESNGFNAQPGTSSGKGYGFSLDPKNYGMTQETTATGAIVQIAGYEGVRVKTASGYGLYPATNNAFTLGTSSYRWSTIYGVKGNFSASVTATTSVVTPLLQASGGLDIVANGSAAGSRLYLTTNVFRPWGDDAGLIDLGVSSIRWRSVYSVGGNFSGAVSIGDTLTVTAGGAKVTGDTTINGNLVVSGDIAAA